MEKENTKATKANSSDQKVVHYVSEEVKKQLLEKHDRKNLRLIELEMDDNGTEMLEVAVLVPTRTVQGQFLKFVDNDPLKAQKILVKACLLTSNDQVMNSDFLFSTCVSGIAELFPIGQYKVKNF